MQQTAVCQTWLIILLPCTPIREALQPTQDDTHTGKLAAMAPEHMRKQSKSIFLSTSQTPTCRATTGHFLQVLWYCPPVFPAIADLDRQLCCVQMPHLLLQAACK